MKQSFRQSSLSWCGGFWKPKHAGRTMPKRWLCLQDFFTVGTAAAGWCAGRPAIKGKRYIYYQCSGSKQNKGSCTSHNLRDEKLYNIVRNALQMQIQIVMEETEFVESIRQAQQEPYRVRRIERQIRQLTAEKAHTQGIKEKFVWGLRRGNPHTGGFFELQRTVQQAD